MPCRDIVMVAGRTDGSVGRATTSREWDPPVPETLRAQRSYHTKAHAEEGKTDFLKRESMDVTENDRERFER